MKKNILPASIISIAIVILGMFLKSSFDNFTYKDRVVTVRGLSEKEVMANKVTCPLVYKCAGNNIDELNVEIKEKMNIIKTFMINHGINDSCINILPTDVVNRSLDPYMSTNDGQKFFKYFATTVIMCSTYDVEKVVNMLKETQALIDLDVNLSNDYRYNVEYEYTLLNDIKPSMIEEATKNARLAAEKFAQDSNSKIGKIKNATQGQFSITNRDAYTGHIKTIRVVTSVNFYLKD